MTSTSPNWRSRDVTEGVKRAPARAMLRAVGLGAQLIERLRSAGYQVAARKPAQSHEPGDLHTDAEILARASGEDPDSVCPARPL